MLWLAGGSYLSVMLRLERRMPGAVNVAAAKLLLRRQLRTRRQRRRRRVATRHQRFAHYSGVVERRRSVLRSHRTDHRRRRPVKVLLLLLGRHGIRTDSSRLLRMGADVLLLTGGEIATRLRFSRFAELLLLLVDVAGCGRIATTSGVRLLVEILAHLLLLVLLVMLLLLLLLRLLLLHVVDSRRVVRAGLERTRQTRMVNSQHVAVPGGHADVNRCRCVIMVGLNDVASSATSAVRRHIIRTHFRKNDDDDNDFRL